MGRRKVLLRQKLYRQPVQFKQNIRERGLPMVTQIQVAGRSKGHVDEGLSKMEKVGIRKAATLGVFAALVFPVALWVMLGMGVVHSHFAVVPALGYWETVVVLLAVNAASGSIATGVKSNG